MKETATESSKEVLDLLHRKSFFFENFMFDRITYISKLRNIIMKSGFKNRANKAMCILMRFLKKKYSVSPTHLIRFILHNHFHSSLIKEIKMKRRSILIPKKLSERKFIIYMIFNLMNESNKYSSGFNTKPSYKKYGSKTFFFLSKLINYIQNFLSLSRSELGNTFFVKSNKVIEEKIYKMRYFSNNKTFRSRQRLGKRSHSHINF